MDSKTLVHKTHKILKAKGYDISLCHIYEMYSEVSGYKSWNEAKSKDGLIKAVLKVHDFQTYNEPQGRNELPQAVVPDVSDIDLMAVERKYSNLKIDNSKLQCLLNGSEVRLTMIEYKIMLYLLRKFDGYTTWDELMSEIWEGVTIPKSSLRRYLVEIDSKLLDWDYKIYLEGVKGFCFKKRVREKQSGSVSHFKILNSLNFMAAKYFDHCDAKYARDIEPCLKISTGSSEDLRLDENTAFALSQVIRLHMEVSKNSQKNAFKLEPDVQEEIIKWGLRLQRAFPKSDRKSQAEWMVATFGDLKVRNGSKISADDMHLWRSN